ncbi:hypothetical protein [Kalamiella sp. sgz302252]|uniref:hypothetical protein n=1 Tax=Pantoea sp. sgz302252 TaxID=3341827 RepID=UPI0036D2D42B
MNIKIKDAIIAPFPRLRGRHHASSAALPFLPDAAPPIRSDFSARYAARHAVRFRFAVSHE